jgi:putative endonuclease
MDSHPRSLLGPRGAIGASAEEAVAAVLVAAGWTILARNVRVGQSEVDIVALDPDVTLVIVEVRSRSGPRYGAPEESVDARKVERLYVAGWRLAGSGRLPDGSRIPAGPFRVDLITVVRDGHAKDWTVTRHLRALVPPG